MHLAPSDRHHTAHPASDSPRRQAELRVHRPDDPGREEVEAFIRAVYARRYGANVTGFATVLVSKRDRTGILAAAGYRHAADGPLFLERYLSSPVESVLGSVRNGQPSRHGIVEVGHLSATVPGEGRRLILALAHHLGEVGHEWVVSTATEELLHLFRRVGLTPQALGLAHADALGEEAAHWGSYYDHRPVVVAGSLRQGLRQLVRRADRADARGTA